MMTMDSVDEEVQNLDSLKKLPKVILDGPYSQANPYLDASY